MGDRAVIVVTDNHGNAPAALYLHSGGDRVGDILTNAAPRMRKGDSSYALARLIGEAHNQTSGALSLGVLSPPKDLDPDTLAAYSHGDAGVFLVNVDTGNVKTFGGSGFRGSPPSLPLPLYEG